MTVVRRLADCLLAAAAICAGATLATYLKDMKRGHW